MKLDGRFDQSTTMRVKFFTKLNGEDKNKSESQTAREKALEEHRKQKNGTQNLVKISQQLDKAGIEDAVLDVQSILKKQNYINITIFASSDNC